MREKKSSESRRNLLKSITAGGGAIVAGKSLPESWSRPVVDSVLLPAHAQTSPTSRTFFGPATVVSIGSRDRNDSTLFADIYRMLVNDAYAGGPPDPGQSNGTILAIENGDSVDVTFQNRKNTVRRRGSLLKDGTTGSLAEEDKGANCTVSEEDSRVEEITDDYIVIDFWHDGVGWRRYIVTAGAGSLPDLFDCVR